jgi:hypothetical protein
MDAGASHVSSTHPQVQRGCTPSRSRGLPKELSFWIWNVPRARASAAGLGLARPCTAVCTMLQWIYGTRRVRVTPSPSRVPGSFLFLKTCPSRFYATRQRATARSHWNAMKSTLKVPGPTIFYPVLTIFQSTVTLPRSPTPVPLAPLAHEYVPHPRRSVWSTLSYYHFFCRRRLRNRWECALSPRRRVGS